MKNLYFFLSIGILTVGCGTSAPVAEAPTTLTKSEVDKTLTDLTDRALAHLKTFPIDSTNIPRSVKEDGSLHGVVSRDWTSGFYAGTLWNLYEFSGNKEIETAAKTWTAFQEKEKFDDHTHDLGFKIYCSFGEGYELQPNETYKNIIIRTAQQLIERYNPTVGAIRSWDHNRDKWEYPVIIDNMMNLELLFAATKLSGDSTFYNIAVAHADKTLNNHFREDNSSYHVIDYFPETGEVRKRNTHQGANHESAWSRGQAWGLYGYAMCYRETGEQRYLDQAHRIAEYFYTHPNMPEDMIPYWDFDAPEIPNEPRDASAGAIAVGGLLSLIELDDKNSEKYQKWADTALSTLRSPEYQTSVTPFFLDHSVGSKAHNSEVDVPINYADYYYVEALLQRLEMF